MEARDNCQVLQGALGRDQRISAVSKSFFLFLTRHWESWALHGETLEVSPGEIEGINEFILFLAYIPIVLLLFVFSCIFIYKYT